ncbi:hypothetical protein AAL_06798 [Moelleriella libera RCEF 2490]|uniref:Tat pathway signal sequence n=1 Tax=Moelleriella libera RCEF 2490 TaxID=1081109 RepID=A0A167YA99_9HYPO|nr:hypothetical protein AAL_06798 [Moelleriella libera RCEF 2490]
MEAPVPEALTNEKNKENDFEGGSTTSLGRVGKANTQLSRKVWAAAFFHVASLTLLALSYGLILRKSSPRSLGGFNLEQKKKKTLTSLGVEKGPAREAVEYIVLTINNQLDHDTAYRGLPSPALDQAWDDLQKYRVSAVSPSLLEDDDTARVEDGTDRALITLDVFETLHCLNYIRRYIFRSHYEEEFPLRGRDKHLYQVNRCVDMIRESLVCHADIAIVTYDWVKHRFLPFPNFVVDHECKNWDRIMAWAEANKAPSPQGDAVLTPSLNAGVAG